METGIINEYRTKKLHIYSGLNMNLFSIILKDAHIAIELYKNNQRLQRKDT